MLKRVHARRSCVRREGEGSECSCERGHCERLNCFDFGMATEVSKRKPKKKRMHT